MPVTISVIINNYNYSRYLIECIESVLAQKMRPTEIICVDDGSVDESLLLLKRFSGDIKVISQKNLGQYRAVLTGLSAASGNLCFFLDADDTWEPDHIQTIHEAFENDPTQSLVSSSLSCFGEYQGLHPLTSKNPSIPYTRTRAIAFMNGSFIGRPTSTCAMWRERALSLFHETQSLEQQFRICADEILVYGTSLMGWKTTLLENRSVNYRVHAENHFFKLSADRNKSEEKLRREMLFQHLMKIEHFELTPREIYREMQSNNSAALQKKYRNIIRKLLKPGPMRLFWQWRFRNWKAIK